MAVSHISRLRWLDLGNSFSESRRLVGPLLIKASMSFVAVITQLQRSYSILFNSSCKSDLLDECRTEKLVPKFSKWHLNGEVEEWFQRLMGAVSCSDRTFGCNAVPVPPLND